MKYIVDIKGEIEGDYEIIGEYKEQPQDETSKIEHKAYNEGFKDGVDQGIKLSERPQGEWIYSQGSLKCSICGYEDTRNHKANSNFCSNCGARMQIGGAE